MQLEDMEGVSVREFFPWPWWHYPVEFILE